MAAFEHAVSLGYHYLETDVHATSDGVLVAFHDDELDRMTDHVGAIADLPWSVVRRARVGGEHEIPRLEDVLGSWPLIKVNIDPKHDAAVEPLVEVIRRSGAHARVAIGAFSTRRLGRLRRALGPEVCFSLGPAGVARLRAASMGVPVGRLPGACVQVPPTTHGVPLLDTRFIERAQRHGLQVHAWTIDDASEMRRLLDLGVDGIMTDQPTRLRQILQERGEWAGS